jgi:tartrate dehydrogenase/decarboxylase / D-malate dehydrogenase
MRHYRKAVLPGDGMRPEVITESIQTLTTLDHVHGGFHLEMQRFTRGTERYLCAGVMMLSDGLTVHA